MKGQDLVTPSVGLPGARVSLQIGRWRLPGADKGVTAALGPVALLHNAGVLGYMNACAPMSPGTSHNLGCSSSGSQDVVGEGGGEFPRTREAAAWC